jgi:hypothetical protein
LCFKYGRESAPSPILVSEFRNDRLRLHDLIFTLERPAAPFISSSHSIKSHYRCAYISIAPHFILLYRWKQQRREFTKLSIDATQLPNQIFFIFSFSISIPSRYRAHVKHFYRSTVKRNQSMFSILCFPGKS